MPKVRLLVALPAAAIALLAAVGPQATALPATLPTTANVHAQRVCDASHLAADQAACHAEVLVDSAGKPVSPQATSGAVGPAQLKAAYNLPGVTATPSPTVAIVDAYGYPNAASDLTTYRSNNTLPACSTTDSCLTIVNQAGKSTPLPAFNLGWAQEQALDLDAVSAACPTCKIVLVQANSNSYADLGAAEKAAANVPGVVAISNSWGGGDARDTTYGTYFNHPGIAVTASTGDNNYRGASYPASSAYVTAVGGTTLTQDSSTSRGWTEKVWSSGTAGTGSGCSAYNTAPVGQTYAVTGCKKHATADVAADADPYTGLMVYGPTSVAKSTLMQFGGTSLSSPIIASVYALSGHTGGVINKKPVYANSIPYTAASSSYSSNFNDVTSGSNGTCSTDVWCIARNGWDGPTGLGTPWGTGGF